MQVLPDSLSMVCERAIEHATSHGVRFELPTVAGPWGWTEAVRPGGNPAIQVTLTPRLSFAPGQEVCLADCAQPPEESGGYWTTSRVRLVRKLLPEEFAALGILIDGKHEVSEGEYIIAGTANDTLKGTVRVRCRTTHGAGRACSMTSQPTGSPSMASSAPTPSACRGEQPTGA